MKPGDKVSVVDDILEGTVIEIIQNSVTFTDTDGFEHTYPIDRLVVIPKSGINLDKIKPPKKDNSNTSKKVSKKNQDTLVVDLHIEKLQAKHKHLDNNQILSIQLQEVKRKLFSFNNKHYQKLILIHGEGKGVLKREIEKILKQQHYDYTQASFQKYGTGAILVLK